MKLLLSVLTGILILATSASARLGETPDQCQMRYGTSNGSRGASMSYYKDKFDIFVLFRDGKSVEETFIPNVGGSLTDDLIAEMLTANAEGSTWFSKSNEPAYKTYERRDRGGLATFDGKSLTIKGVSRSTTIAGKQPTSGF